MRKAVPFLLLIAALALVSCKPEENSLTVDCPIDRAPIERFSLCLPPDWIAATEQFGEEGSMLVRVQSASATGSLMQIHVKKDPLQERVESSLSFAQRAIEITRERAPNYVAVSTEPMTIGDDETLLHIFDASPDAKAEPIRYYQFVTTNEGIAYGFTAIMHTQITEEMWGELLQIFKSVRFM
ncbi:MAG: hypothetical protein AAB853_06325 [Patescibacteria group bacterium]